MTFGVHVNSIELKNVVLYRHAKFKFAKGITYIVGRNKNRRDPDATNMTGKSLLFSMIPQVAIAASPLPVKGSRALQKDGLSKDSTLRLSVTVNDKPVEIVKTLKTHSILVNGSDTQTRTKTLVKDALNQLFSGLTEEEFFTLYYINTLRPNPFHYGTAPARMQFLANLFRLDDLDNVKRWLSREYATIKQNVTLVHHLEKELQGLTVPEDWKAKKEQYEKQVNEQRTLVEKIGRLRDQLTAHRVAETVAPLQEKIRQLEGQKPESPSVLRARVAELEEQVASGLRAEAVHERNEQIRLRLKKNPYRELDLDVAMRRLEQAVAAQRELDALCAPEKIEIDSASLALADRYPDFEDKSMVYEAECRSLERELKVFRSHFCDSTECPTCKTDVPKKTLHVVEHSISKRISVLKKRVRISRRITRAKLHAADVARYKEQRAVYESKRARLRKAIDIDIERMREYTSLKPRLEKTQRVDVAGLKADLEKARALLQTAKQLKELKAQCATMLVGYEPPAISKKKLHASLKELESRSHILAERLPKFRSRLDETLRMIKQRKKIVEQLKSLKTGDSPKLYEALLDIYGKSGIKLAILQRIASMIDANMNKYSKLIYPEPIEIKTTVTHTKFDVTAYRRLHGKTNVSDIRNLSGAESRVFPLLLLLALLPLVPASRRWDTLILDEPETNMDPGMRSILVKVLLPALNRIIPKIVVISPNESLVPAGARVFTVVKAGSESTLVRGIA